MFNYNICKCIKVGYNLVTNRNLNNNITSITSIHRKCFARMYPTKVILPNGASINIRYPEPRQIIKLPLDMSLLTEEEKRIRLARRKPKKKIQVAETFQDKFDSKKYLKYLKK